jgi:cytidine deaminase/N-acetylglutamate synthase-like GNAT family acetyltransferase
METIPLDRLDYQLIQAARDVLEKNFRPERHTVGAAVLCGSGRVYAGINVEACGYGPCAEPVAIGAAFSSGEREILRIVAVCREGKEYAVLSPCGNCRQLIIDHAPHALVTFRDGGLTVKVRAIDLLPGPFLMHFPEDAADGTPQAVRTSLRFEVRRSNEGDRQWIDEFTAAHWGAEIIVVHKTVYRPSTLPGFKATLGDRVLGLATYHIEVPACELVTLNSVEESRGVGTALIDAVKEEARRSGCTRLWLITTNDNLRALEFYQRKGFTIAAVYPNALAESRKIKPQIPLVGANGIPLRDEIEMEMGT